jgi:hypothetical protein
MSEIRVLGTTNRGTALVDDVVFPGPDGLDVEAYLVRSGAAGGGTRRAAGALPRPADVPALAC